MQSRRGFLIAGTATLAGCASGASTGLFRSNDMASSRVSPALCIAGQPNCGHPTPAPGTHLGSVSRPKTATYAGGVFKSTSGQAFGSIDSNGASVNGVRTSVLSINAYRLTSQTISASHPVFSNQAFKLGTTTYTPRTAQAGLPMYRWSDPTYGSGAVWINSSGLANVAYTGMQDDMIAQGGHGDGSTPGAAPTECQVQATGLAAIGIGAAIAGLISGAQSLQGNPYTSTVATLLGILGLGTSISAMAPCPATQSGDPTPASIMPNFNFDSGGLYAGDGTLPDGGGGGTAGTDQFLCA